MDHDQPLQNINDDILLPQAYVLNGYSRSLLRNPFHASNQKKKVNASKYESVDTSEDIFELNNSHKNKILRNRQISSHRDGSDINAQKVYKVTQDFLEENGLAERSHQPIVDLEKLLAESDQEKNEIVKEISMDYFTVRFEENPDILHERFMKQVGHILHRDPSRPNTSDSGTLYRPQTASSKRSITPSLSGNNPIRPKIPNKEDNESVYKSSPSRPHTGSTVQNDTKEPKKKIQKQTEIDKAKIAVDFLQNSPLLASHRFKGPKSLADWKMEKKTQDQIWDSKSFSVQDFIRDYVKLRDLGNQKMISLAPAKVSPKRESAIDKSVKVIPQLQQAKRFSEIPNKFRRMSTFASKNIKGSLISAGNVETPKFTDQHPEYGNILQKIPLDRSSEEKSILFKVFRDFKAFKKLSDFTLGEVVGALVLQEYESHRAIFKQGDFGTAWYIILSGNVSVQVSKTGRIEDSREVVKLHAGDGFGELALANDEPRAATILSVDFCQLVYIDRADFNRIVKFTYEKELKEKILFLKKFPLLAEFNVAALKSVAQVMEWKKFQPGTFVIAQGDPSNNFCIIRNGEAVVTRAIKTPEKENAVQVVIGKLKRHDYFGEEGVHCLDSDPALRISNSMPSSIIASKNTKELEVGFIACFDAKNKIAQIPKNPIHLKSAGEVIRIYHENKLQKKWDKQKKIFFDKMLQERLIDPNMNTDKWKKLSSKKKKKKKVWV